MQAYDDYSAALWDDICSRAAARDRAELERIELAIEDHERNLDDARCVLMHALKWVGFYMDCRDDEALERARDEVDACYADIYEIETEIKYLVDQRDALV